jgi:glutaredoxin
MSRRVIVYGKPGCHLCEDALQLLRDLRAEFDLAIEEIDITTDRALFKNYFDKIPVLLIDDRTTLAAPITKHDLVQVLNSPKFP